VVRDAVDVVQVRADAARRQRREPGGAVDEAEARLHLAVADVVPVAGLGVVVRGQERQGFVRVRDFVVVQAALDAQRHATRRRGLHEGLE